MQVKKFEAPTIQEALETIKRELGPEAIILQTKKNKRGFGLMSKASVEVTAAVSERALQRKGFTERKLPDDTRDAIQSLPADRQANVYDKYVDRHLDRAAASTRDQVALGAETGKKARAKALTATRYADIGDEERSSAPASPRVSAAARAAVKSAPIPPAVARSLPPSQAIGDYSAATRAGNLEDEVKTLKRMLEEIKINQDEATSATTGAGRVATGLGTPALQDAFEQLVLNGVDRRFALSLSKKVAFDLGDQHSQSPDDVLDAMAGEIMRSTEVAPALSSTTGTGRGPRVICLVGPTGVGKTTTIAKMASEALLKRNLKVGLVNVDSYKVAAFDQLATYAKILNIPFRSASSSEDLRQALNDFQRLDLVILDTTGRSQRDPSALKEMLEMIGALPEVEFQLVLSATTRDQELYDMANRFAIFRPRGLVISKLDEATLFGSVYNVSQKSKLPLIYFTTGQRVPEDIEEATRERVAALVMDL